MAGPAKRIPAGAWLASMVAINSASASLREVQSKALLSIENCELVLQILQPSPCAIFE
jgi:hypothetical protein